MERHPPRNIIVAIEISTAEKLARREIASVRLAELSFNKGLGLEICKKIPLSCCSMYLGLPSNVY